MEHLSILVAAKGRAVFSVSYVVKLLRSFTTERTESTEIPNLLLVGP